MKAHRCYSDPGTHVCTVCGADEPPPWVIPPIGPTSEGAGELAGGDVQAMPPRPKTRVRRNRHDQRTPLPGDPGFVRPSLTADILRDMLDTTTTEEK